jgi:ornithine cyclodeaminase/alanine dehydrogenase-like protein (mu-crystallin family)
MFYDEFRVDQYPDIIDVIAGRAVGRQNDKEITFFWNHIGAGFQFAAVGARVYQLALEKGLGEKIPTDWFLETVHP